VSLETQRKDQPIEARSEIERLKKGNSGEDIGLLANRTLTDYHVIRCFISTRNEPFRKGE
jgi:hypothetical protein